MNRFLTDRFDKLWLKFAVIFIKTLFLTQLKTQNSKVITRPLKWDQKRSVKTLKCLNSGLIDKYRENINRVINGGSIQLLLTAGEFHGNCNLHLYKLRSRSVLHTYQPNSTVDKNIDKVINVAEKSPLGTPVNSEHV